MPTKATEEYKFLGRMPTKAQDNGKVIRNYQDRLSYENVLNKLLIEITYAYIYEFKFELEIFKSYILHQ